ncbi:hypothetical protein [Bradyrhizobium neotropicale]|uniref:hypothetical protein n=1 Tax=Bradyrhizobium neotropicale TaxID=1497615 RepID=UPI001AD63703|nr:hypothetical protein [Bradyrhizobium neotropicale]MBO4227220.1 hypothetical protein [Bradyrhizobium neotropicale]
MAEVDTSIYKALAPRNPLEQAGQVVDFANKAQQNRLLQQEEQSREIGLSSARLDLAYKQLQQLRGILTSRLADPDVGKRDLTKSITEDVASAVRMGLMTPEQAAEGLRGVPNDPRDQFKWLTQHAAKAVDHIQQLDRFLGVPQTRNVGGADITTQTPQIPGLPTRTRAVVENTLPPTTEGVQANPNLPGYGGKYLIGRPGIPTVQQGPGVMPPTQQEGQNVPARAKVPSSAKVVGDDEAIRTGLYEMRRKPVVTSLPPGTGTAMEGAANEFNSALGAAGKYAQRVNPLRQAIPILEKMRPEDIGPTSERWNDLKSTAITLGAGKIIGGIDPEKIKDYNELKKYFSQYASQAAATLGPKTNDGLATAVTSNPNVKMDKLSATELSKVALGVERMQQAGVREFNSLVEQGKMQPSDFNRFMLKWGSEQDPRAFVYDLMDDKAQEKVRKLSQKERDKIAEGMRLAEKWGLLGDVHRD